MSRYSELKSLIVGRYWDEAYGFLYDTIQPDGTLKKDMTVNAVIPVFFDIIEPDKAESILKWMESDEFTTSWGVRTRARSDPEYDGKSYQKGGVWPFVTGWVAYSEFSHGNFKKTLPDASFRRGPQRSICTRSFADFSALRRTLRKASRSVRILPVTGTYRLRDLRSAKAY
jgi:glycogen debranching enzyme